MSNTKPNDDRSGAARSTAEGETLSAADFATESFSTSPKRVAARPRLSHMGNVIPAPSVHPSGNHLRRLVEAGVFLIIGVSGVVAGLRAMRSGARRLEDAASHADDIELDDLDEAFVRARMKSVLDGRIALSPPISAQAWRTLSDKTFEDAFRNARLQTRSDAVSQGA